MGWKLKKSIFVFCIFMSTYVYASDFVVSGRVISVSVIERVVVSSNEEGEVVAVEEYLFTVDRNVILRGNLSKESFSPILDLRKNIDLLQTVGFDFPQYLDSSSTLHLIFSSDQEKNKDICEIILLDSELDSLGKKKLLKFIDINNIESHEYDNYMTLTCKENTK